MRFDLSDSVQVSAALPAVHTECALRLTPIVFVAIVRMLGFDANSVPKILSARTVIMGCQWAVATTDVVAGL